MHRVGIGWDIHELIDGRALYLGGVNFVDSMQGLRGHSDADVVCHAIVDALLGAAGLGDIGQHFPDTDPQYKDAAGVLFLEAAGDLLAKNGYRIVNVDCTVMSDVVHLGERKREMSEVIAHHLDVDPGQVSIKATTWEGRGPIGRGEAIACQAVAMISGE